MANRIVIASLLAAVAFAVPKPTLVGAHSHNDYNRKRPLFEALDAGLGSVEADVCLVDGELRIGHEPKSTRKGRTLTSMYLQPLLERFNKLGKKVNDDGQPLVLLVDIKTDAERTYAAIKTSLEPYRAMLTSYDDATHKGAVQVILSGNVPRNRVASEPIRWVAVDGRPDDFEANPPADLVPWVSTSWLGNFKWLGIGEMSSEDKARLDEWVGKAHAQGRKLRFWATPDAPVFWTELRKAGVDVIGTDNPDRLAKFLRDTPG